MLRAISISITPLYDRGTTLLNLIKVSYEDSGVPQNQYQHQHQHQREENARLLGLQQSRLHLLN